MTKQWMSLEQYHKQRNKQLATDFDKHWMPEDNPKYVQGVQYQVIEIDDKDKRYKDNEGIY